MKSSRVIIIEDDKALREGLTDWLAQEYEVSSYESAEDFLGVINDFEFEDGVPTCILLDFQMPGMTGVDLQTNLALTSIECPIIFMSGNAQQADIIDAWRGGAMDFLLKPFSGIQVSEALKALFIKNQKLKLGRPPAIAGDVLINIPISQREAEVLLLLGSGHRQSEVAEMLNITLRTVKMHRSNLKNKLGLNTIVELTRYCDEHRLSIEKVVKN
ncbi:response regulator transcription factor [Polynucleobacter sp. AP-Nino-20-G2]|uniref:response regulator transcription factor n=1 Tax=Polynucleobacter sp. AP-Nino-20-G2 TaxID=2576917 RepID=UPI001BFCF513|nr:response regulator [Polynucleobacter sp. AP-Nino-20-G2]QWE17160.1 response regulator [Polynucleobacter sp. AP-Nino-20-G2]